MYPIAQSTILTYLYEQLYAVSSMKTTMSLTQLKNKIDKVRTKKDTLPAFTSKHIHLNYELEHLREQGRRLFSISIY